MRQYVPAEQLWTNFNGSLEFEYDHSVYWPAFVNLCSERREERRQRWVAGGQHIGESEDYLAGHAQTGVAGPTQAVEKTETTELTETVQEKAAPAEPTPVVAPQASAEEVKKDKVLESIAEEQTAAAPAAPSTETKTEAAATS